jgi:hypothetical protein
LCELAYVHDAPRFYAKPIQLVIADCPFPRTQLLCERGQPKNGYHYTWNWRIHCEEGRHVSRLCAVSGFTPPLHLILHKSLNVNLWCKKKLLLPTDFNPPLLINLWHQTKCERLVYFRTKQFYVTAACSRNISHETSLIQKFLITSPTCTNFNTLLSV